MGGNTPSLNDIEGCKYFSQPVDPEVDVTIILGESPNSQQNCSLLLMRFWRTGRFSRDFSETKLWNDIMEILPRNGTSATRIGGSSGTLQRGLSKTFLDFVHQPGAFPRKAMAVKFVREKLFYRCLYISPYTGKVTTRTKYSPAHKGGVFKVTVPMLRRSPFLFEFAEYKIISAIICKNLLHFTGVAIQPLAVDNELQNLSKACVGDHAESPFSSKRQRILHRFIAKSRHTVVTHAVGYHRDIFDKGNPILENKKCFVVPGFGKGCDRGGAGKDYFVAALLDW
jgi:hypothetical protein